MGWRPFARSGSGTQDARILLITSFADDERVFPAIKAGAMGYLLKDTPREQLVQAIRDVAGGQAVLHPTIAFKVIQEIRQPMDRPATTDPLTPARSKRCTWCPRA